MEISNRKPNILKYLSDALRVTQEFGNKAEFPEAIPLIGGLGLGDLFIGDAQDATERMSYGESLTTGAGQTTQLHPGIADLAGLAYIPASMAKAPVKAGAKSLASSLRKPPAPPNPRNDQLVNLSRNMSREGRDTGIQAQNRAAQERDFPTFQARPRTLDKTLDERTAHGASVDRTPSLQQPTKFDLLPPEIKNELIKARVNAMSKPRAAPAPRTVQPVQPDIGRRDFLKKMGIGAAGVGVMAATPKLLSGALKAMPKAAGTVAKATAPAVAKGGLGALIKPFDIAKDVVLKMYMKPHDIVPPTVSKKVATKMLDEEPRLVDETVADLKRLGVDFSKATEGMGQRISAHVEDGTKDMTGLLKGTKEQTKRARELFDELMLEGRESSKLPKFYSDWMSTGKWGKDGNVLKYLDIDDLHTQDLTGNYELFMRTHK